MTSFPFSIYISCHVVYLIHPQFNDILCRTLLGLMYNSRNSPSMISLLLVSLLNGYMLVKLVCLAHGKCAIKVGPFCADGTSKGSAVELNKEEDSWSASSPFCASACLNSFAWLLLQLHSQRCRLSSHSILYEVSVLCNFYRTCNSTQPVHFKESCNGTVNPPSFHRSHFYKINRLQMQSVAIIIPAKVPEKKRENIESSVVLLKFWY